MMMGIDLILIALVGALAYAFGFRPNFNQFRPGNNSETPVEILKARYARGEISREEFDLMSRDLVG